MQCCCLCVYRQSQQVEKYVFELIEELKRKMKPMEPVNLEVTHRHTPTQTQDHVHAEKRVLSSFLVFFSSLPLFLLFHRDHSSVSIQTPSRRPAVSLVFPVVSTIWLASSAIATLKPWSKVGLLSYRVFFFSSNPSCCFFPQFDPLSLHLSFLLSVFFSLLPEQIQNYCKWRMYWTSLCVCFSLYFQKKFLLTVITVTGALDQ